MIAKIGPILFVLYLFPFASSAQWLYEGKKIIGYFDNEFEKDSTYLLYGDKVILRDQASSNGKAMDTLSIATSVKIISKSSKKIELNGIEWNWYKVKCKSGIGYIAGGLLASDFRKINGGIYLVCQSQEKDKVFAKIRYLKNDMYYGKKILLSNSSYTLDVYGNRGLTGIESMLGLSFYADACGVDAGVHYIFNDGSKLYDAIHCSAYSDGPYYFAEELEFPDNHESESVTYKRFYGEPYENDDQDFNDDDYISIDKEVTYTLSLKWNGDHFEPDVKKLKFVD